MRKVVIFVVVFFVLMISSCSASNINTTVDSDISMQMNEMPEPFDSKSNSGDDSLHNYYSKYVFKFGNINSTLINLVGEKEAEDWFDEHISSEKSGTDTSEMTVLKFIEHFDITKEELTKAVSESKYPDGWIINLSDIEVIYSEDENLINQTFVNEYALLYNGEIYTPEWLYNHSIEEYAKEGLPIESVNVCMAKMSDLPFTEEAQKAIADKSNNYKRYYANRVAEEQTLAITTASTEDCGEMTVSTTATKYESSRALSKQEFMDIKFSRALGWDGSIIALTSDGNIVTWGNNVRGKIGNGERGGYTEDGYSVPVSSFYIDLRDDIVDIETSENDSFALTRLGEVYAWGSNSFGELGINSGFILKPEKLDIDEFVVKVAPSNATNLFLTNDGQVLLSGLDILKYKSLPERNENIAYEYNPEISEEPSAVTIAEAGYKKLELPFNCRDISIGILHYAFLSEDGEVYVEGTLIGDYELSKPNLTHDKLTKVDFPEKITEIESGSGFIAALSETGKVYLYGTRESVFFNEEYDAQLSENVFLKGGVVGVSSIDCDMYCVVLTDENNDAYGFGIDRWGVFGKEADSNYEIISTPIFLRNNVKECVTDTLNSIFVSEDGKISMYGANGFKQISFLNGDFN